MIDTEKEQDGEQIAHLHYLLEQVRAIDIDASASTILAGLSFVNDVMKNPVSAFSGG